MPGVVELWLRNLKMRFQVTTLPHLGFRQLIYSLCVSLAKCHVHKNHLRSCQNAGFHSVGPASGPRLCVSESKVPGEAIPAVCGLGLSSRCQSLNNVPKRDQTPDPFHTCNFILNLNIQHKCVGTKLFYVPWGGMQGRDLLPASPSPSLAIPEAIS